MPILIFPSDSRLLPYDIYFPPYPKNFFKILLPVPDAEPENGLNLKPKREAWKLKAKLRSISDLDPQTQMRTICQRQPQ
jgi:hypothetical protein